MIPAHSCYRHPVESQVRIGIAGLGRSGWGIHARLIESLPDQVRVAAVYDPLPARREEAVGRFGCAAHGDFEALIADPGVDVVVVAVPSHLHAEYSVAALRAGKHVVCEKPMATSVAEAERMTAAAAETGKLLTVFQNYRYRGDVIKVREVAASGVLGRVVMVRITHHGFARRWDWQTLQRYGGGSMNNTGPHVIDMGLLLFGDAEPEVTCVRDRVRTLGDADDHVLILLRAPGAPTVQIEITAACAYPQEQWLVMGTEGGLTGSGSALRWRYVKPGSLPERTLSTEPTPDRSYNRETVEWVEHSWASGEADGGPGEAGFYLDLHACIRAGGPLPVAPEQVLTQMRVMEECRRQAPLAPAE
ncbi:MAG: Gfo/Idh/MocA family oxidoreductase [Spirochaetaceae bacterium]|nr:Gfo/Idh/MocA family oxidoreductase [Spirochaetaceae bacterium]